MKYAWIEVQRDSYPVVMLCELLGVSRSGWYAARRRQPSARQVSNERLLRAIRQCQKRHRGRYGRRRAHQELRAGAVEPINEKRVGRLMREAGLQCRKRRRYRPSIDAQYGSAVAPNVLRRDFSATAPNQKWLADMTQVATAEGWLHVALVLDLFSRKLIGWAMSDSRTHQVTLEALQMALGWRDPPPGLIHHSDRGGQYAIYPYRKVLAARGITMSMSRKGNCWDNAPMESVNGTIKVECVRGARFKTRAEAARELMQYFGYYNTERLHSSLGYMTPSAFELRWQSEATDDEAARVAHRRPASCSNDATRRPAVDNACARGRGVH